LIKTIFFSDEESIPSVRFVGGPVNIAASVNGEIVFFGKVVCCKVYCEAIERFEAVDAPR